MQNVFSDKFYNCTIFDTVIITCDMPEKHEKYCLILLNHLIRHFHTHLSH